MDIGDVFIHENGLVYIETDECAVSLEDGYGCTFDDDERVRRIEAELIIKE